MMVPLLSTTWAEVTLQAGHRVVQKKARLRMDVPPWILIEGSLEVKLPTIWTDEKQRWEEPERREVEERRVREEKESEERS